MGNKGFFLFCTLLIISTDLAIFLNIPFLRQIFGFLFLTILPGLLILQILKLNKIGSVEKFVLSVGLSISFLMFFGLLINNLSLGLGYETPLSTVSLLICFNLVAIVLIFIAYRMNKDSVFSLPSLNLSGSEKAFLIVPILFPALSIFGMHVMNTTYNNIILLFLLFLIPVYVVFVCFSNHKFSNRLYPVVIFLISISLLLLLALRSNHIIGVDTHVEYYYFQTTLDNGHWSVFGWSTLAACLSISLLPTVYQSILNPSSEFLFKILYSLLFSISPLVIYVLSKRYIGEFYGFLASCFFMFQSSFLGTASNSRTCIAILFFALAMMTLFSDKIDPLKKRVLFIIFMASCMVSHYSTTYIFFFILLGAFVGMEILSKKYTYIKEEISLTLVILFFAFIFFWYSQVTEAAFSSGVDFIGSTLSNLNNFFIEESRASSIEGLYSKELKYGIISRVRFVVTWSSFILIGIGVLTMIKRYKEMVMISIPNIKHKKPDFLKDKFDVGYVMIALVCSGLLVMMIMLPYLSIGYDIYRLYPLAIVILSVCFIIGGMVLSEHFFFFIKHFLSKERTCAKKETLFAKQKAFTKNNSFFSQAFFLRKVVGKAFLSKKRFVLKEKQKSLTKNATQNPQVRAYLIILLILIPYFLFDAGVIHTTLGLTNVLILSSDFEDTRIDYMYMHDQECCGAKWLKECREKRIKLYSDPYGNLRLTSHCKIPDDGSVDVLSLTENGTCNGYIYLRYYAVVNGKLLGRCGSYNLSEYSHQFVGKNKIYANGGSEVYKT